MNTKAGSFALNFWTLTSSKILSRLVSIGVMVYLARELGADVLGQYVTVMSLITFFLAFADMGVTNLVIKEVSKDKSLAASYLNNFFALQILVGIIVIVLIMGTGRLSGYGAVVLLALAVGSIGPFFSGMSNAYQSLLNAHELFYPFAVIEMVCVFVYLAGNVGVVVAGEGVVALVALTSVVMLVKLLLGAGWSYRLGIRVRRRFDAGLMKRLLISGLPFLLINGGHFAFQRLDVLFLSWTVSNERVGLYAAASRPVFASLFLLASIGALLYPVFSRLLVQDPAAARRRYERGSGYLLVFATGVALFFYLAAPVVIALMYGDAFYESVSILRLLAWFLPLFAAGLFASNVLMVSEHVWKAVYATLIAFVVLIVSEPLLIAWLEIQGAAIGVLCAEAVAMALYIYWVRVKLGFNLRPRVFVGTAAAALTVVLFEGYAVDAAAAAFTSPALATAVTIIAGMTVFLLIVFLSKAFTADDVKDIRGLMASQGGAS